MSINKETFLNVYVCPECGYSWPELWDCGCDSECPECDVDDIGPILSRTIEEVVELIDAQRHKEQTP